MRACSTFKALRRVAAAVKAELRPKRQARRSRVGQANVKARWSTFGKQRRGEISQLGRVGMVVARRHLNMGQCCVNGRLTVALCHSVARKSLGAGDGLLVVSPAPKSSNGCKPVEYKDAIKALGGRAVALGAQVGRCTSPQEYCSKRGLGRPDCIYRELKKGEFAPKHKVFYDEGGNKYAERARRRDGEHPAHSRDLKGSIIESTRYVRFPPDLSGAPMLPSALTAVFSGGWSGRGFKWLEGEALAAACRFLSRL